jgi:GntR family transcriptional regulator, rspAB operon transcriptional repressor
MLVIGLCPYTNSVPLIVVFVHWVDSTMSKIVSISSAERESLSNKVYTQLRDAILNRELEPGDKLRIRQMAEDMGISTMPVKEAVNRLAHEGLLQIKPNSGTYVAAVSMREVGELFDLRIALEVLVAEKVINHIDSSVFQKYQDVLKKSERFLRSPGTSKSYLKFMDLDTRFHRLLIEALDNRKYLEIYDSLNLDLYVARCAYVAGVENTEAMHAYLREVQEQHECIYRALKIRNIDTVKCALQEHTDTARTTISHAISQAQDVFV